MSHGQEEDLRNVAAGGGQSSAISQNQPVQALTPAVFGYLEQIYANLTATRNIIDHGVDKPDLSSFGAFQSWFHSSASSALAPPVNHDLTYPLNNYYISSSHNTYILHGNQLTGHASPEAYSNVLRRGCRCVELDVYDPDENASLNSSDEEAEHSRGGGGKRRALSALRNKLRHRRNSPNSPPVSPPMPDMERLTVVDAEMAPLTRTVSRAERLHLLRTEPTVYHGHTAVNRIAFREVCQAIRESAFETSTLPVIVSLEVHASLSMQQLMVDIMIHEWRGHLVEFTDQNIRQLPNPESLRNKILIKVKNFTRGTTAEADALEPVQTNDSVITGSSVTSGHSDGAHDKSTKPSKILESLARLGVYTHAYSFKHLDQPEASYPTHVFSLSEGKIEELHEDVFYGPKLVRHNRDFLVRIYPMAGRIESGNYDPSFSWRQGAQMVAMNWQRLDLGMMLNEGMFAGEDGYVLKPEGFRGSSISTQPHPQRHYLNLTIRLFAAQNLPLLQDRGPDHSQSMRPYVKFQLHVDNHGPPGQGSSRSSDKASRFSRYNLHAHRHGDKKKGSDSDDDDDDDEESAKLKRHSKSGKTCSPDFGGMQVDWMNVPDVVEQLSFVRFKVLDDRPLARDPLVAWSCIRLDRLKPGYRFVHLLDSRGDPCEGVLLVKIEKGLQPH